MLRFTLLIIGLCLTSLQAQAVTLRGQSTVTDNVIRVKDLFIGAERNADHILGAAPRPGKNMVLNAKTLMRVAIAMDLHGAQAAALTALSSNVPRH